MSEMNEKIGWLCKSTFRVTILVLNVDYVTNVTYVLIYLGYTDVEKTRYLSRVYILDTLTYSKVCNME